MKKDLRLEVYASKELVKPVALHVYQIKSNKLFFVKLDIVAEI